MKPLRRVLVVQPYGIGDLLFMTPVLRALKLLPGIECVDLLLGSRTDVIVRGNPHVDEIMIVNKDTFHSQSRMQTVRDVAALGRKLRRKKYDLLLDFSLRCEYAFFSAFFLGIRKRAGFAYKRRAFFHNIRVDLKNGYTGRHVADYYCDLAEKAGVPVRSRWLEFYPSETAALEPFDYLSAVDAPEGFSGWIAVSPGGGESWGRDAHFKRWPVHAFAALLTRLRERVGFRGVLIIGSPSERALSEELQSHLTVPAVNLTGRLSLDQTGWLLREALAFVGNDGGLLHLARAVGRPVAGIYGPVDDGVYGPYPRTKGSAVVFHRYLDCRPCYHRFRYRSDCAHRDCLQRLDGEEAMRQLEEQGFPDFLRQNSLS